MADSRVAKGPAARDAYAAAGVDVTAGERAVDLIQDAVASTRRPEVVGGIGGFGGAIAIPAGYRDPLIVVSTDGVGTKTAIAAALGRYDTIGIDVVAMCADDVVCSGAEPLSFVDYVAVGRLDPEHVAALVAGVAEGCRQAGCALVGGETAEHPGLMAPDAFDLAGTCVGVVERARMLDGRSATAGDTIIGIASSGLHANGFSLVRALIARHELDLAEPYVERLRRTLGDDAADEALSDVRAVATGSSAGVATLGDVLLTPTRIYARTLLALRDALEHEGHDLRGITHITGGGLPGNLPRMLPPELAAHIEPARWPMPSVMRLMATLGGIDDAELRATLNGGIGMAIAVAPAAATWTLDWLAERGLQAWAIGTVVPVAEAGGARYVEGGGG